MDCAPALPAAKFILFRIIVLPLGKEEIALQTKTWSAVGTVVYLQLCRCIRRLSLTQCLFLLNKCTELQVSEKRELAHKNGSHDFL